MRKARVVVVEEDTQLPCPNCGRLPHKAVKVVTQAEREAWTGCQSCWPRAIAKGQLAVISELCRLTDDGEKKNGLPAMLDAAAFGR